MEIKRRIYKRYRTRKKGGQRYWVGRTLKKNYGSIKPLSDQEARGYFHYRLLEKQPFDPKNLPREPPYISFDDIPGDREIHSDRIKSIIHYPKSEPFGHRNITTYQTKGDQFVTIMEDTHDITVRPYPKMKGYISDTEKEAISLHKFLEELRPSLLRKV